MKLRSLALGLSIAWIGCASASSRASGNPHDNAPRDAATQSPTTVDASRDASSATRDAAGVQASSDASSATAPPPFDAAARDDDAGPNSTPSQRTPTLGASAVLAPLAGHMFTPPADQTSIGFYGTDLGFSLAHQGALQLLFGDTWTSTSGTPIDPNNDDTQAVISLVDFPNGDAVDAFVHAHPSTSGKPVWQAAGPPLRFLTKNGKVASIIPYRDGMQLSLPLGRTPVTAWSDGRDGLYAIFLRETALPCASGAGPTCPDGFVCDTGLGSFLGAQSDGALVCVLNEDSGCVAGQNTGFCQDRSSSVYDTTVAGRRLSVVYQQELGNADPTQPGRYLTQVWNTNKFINPNARSVADFDPARKQGIGNDYSPATGADPRAKVFIWGRPWFAGVRQHGHDARLYFQYLDMPTYSAVGQFSVSAHYFTGVVDGVPQFSAKQTDARPLNLSFAPGDPSTEIWDVVGQLDVTFIASLNKWVMLYGGDLTALPLQVMQGEESTSVQHDPEGAIHIRFADQPWGPWTVPQQLLLAQTADDKVASLPSAPSGIVRRPDCSDPTCPPHEALYSASERGFLYAPNIIDEWTSIRDDGVDIYWNVSTWDPYQVVLLKTRLRR